MAGRLDELLKRLDEARDAIAAGDDSAYARARSAALVAFEEDPQEAFDRLAVLFGPGRLATPGGAGVAIAVLGIFCPTGFRIGRDGAEVPRWAASAAPTWLYGDPRWIEMCVRFRRDPQLGRVARWVLRYGDREQVSAALAAARESESTMVARTRSRAVGDLLTRYRKGEHEAVWRELRSHEVIAGDFRDEALAVAAETMARVRRNADVLAERLAARGWHALSGSLRSEPSAQGARVVQRIEHFTGAALPASLRAFWQVVGGIDLVWDHADGEKAPDLLLALDISRMDPLAVAPAERVEYVLEEWRDQRADIDPELADPFRLDLAPDAVHKATGGGGGPAYAIELPFLGADPPFANEPHNLPFVDYLRLAFRWGGFPRLEKHGDLAEVKSLVADLTKGLEPF
jgi:hypothetical protein